MSRTPSQTLPFEAYKRFVQGFRAPMSVRDCKAPLSDTPEAITHDGSIVSGSTWDSIYFLPGNGKAVPPASTPGCSLQIEAGLHLGRGCTCSPAHDASHWLVAK